MTQRLQRRNTFSAQAENILALNIAQRVNALGGYGPGGEVIYQAHPAGCPSVLVTNVGPAKATCMSNGSIAFEVKLPEGLEVRVLDGSFDATEKRQINVPSGNLWLRLRDQGAPPIAALINPRYSFNCQAQAIKVVKLGDPGRAMWYCAQFAPASGVSFETAVKVSLVAAEGGPALLRETFIRNTSKKPLRASLWTYFNLHGTQRFVYNKEIWYDSGMPLKGGEIVVAATVPYSTILQLKRISSIPANGLKPVAATCDYSAFVGDSAAISELPDAVRCDQLCSGAGASLNRFSIATIAASQFALELAAGQSTQLQQSLLYVTQARLLERFAASSNCEQASFTQVAQCFGRAAGELVCSTPDAAQISSGACERLRGPEAPAFEFVAPQQGVISEYAKSLWTGVQELYENCRAHGAKLAQGIELGTRDRGQDMWPKMKEDAARVRADLIHMYSFMYVTLEDPARCASPMTRLEKLHGMFPRQYPSRWDDRSLEVKNDNRPYADSAIWLIDALNLYIRETGDCDILRAKVKTVRLTQPEHPESSGIVGCDKTLTLAEVALEILDCFRRHVQDSPYGLVQIMYGDWCDPVDMFGTTAIGDAGTRGQGRGAQVRLSAHLFDALVNTLELFESRNVRAAVGAIAHEERLQRFRQLASDLRQNIVKIAWEGGADAGFINAIHELRRDGSRPNYAAGQLGYTLGSMRGGDFDGTPRRELLAQAWCLKMLLTQRPYLAAVPGAAAMIQALLNTVDKLLFAEKLGLRLFHPPIANGELARRLVGRMGLLPAGCAENGEYHHAQVMMHRFRLALPEQIDTAWTQLGYIISALRDESLSGPFEMPSTSYASDLADPHFGKGMYFGLSGSTDWIIELLQEIAGVRLALHDPAQPALRIEPKLPSQLGGALSFRRLIHCWNGSAHRRIPLWLEIRRGKAAVRINGKPVRAAELTSLEGIIQLHIELTQP